MRTYLSITGIFALLLVYGIYLKESYVAPSQELPVIDASLSAESGASLPQLGTAKDVVLPPSVTPPANTPKVPTTPIPMNDLACASAVNEGCVLSTISSGGTSGVCTEGHTGSCRYTCINGTWTRNANSCTAQTPRPTACGSNGACSAADVAAHDTPGDCWVYTTTVNKVFDISSYVSGGSPEHPGGDIIAPYCGGDLTAFFTGKVDGHSHSNNARNMILNNPDWFVGVFR